MKKKFMINEREGAAIIINMEGGKVTATLSDDTGNVYELPEIEDAEGLTPEQLKAIMEEGRDNVHKDGQPF